MRNKRFCNFSLQAKISSIYIVANIFVLLANIVLLLGINSMSNELEKVYQENLTLNALSENLHAVQDSMTEYMNNKTTEALENYYRSEQNYNAMIQEMTDHVSSVTFMRMQRNIKNMSEQYLVLASQTIEAKRGRNVEKYSVRYENASELYEYIDSYIYGLNIEQFISNSHIYNELSFAFRIFEYVSMMIMAVVVSINVASIIKFTGNMIQPLKNLSNLANEVAKGNLDIELIEFYSNDEIGVVTNAFNQMVVSIRQYIERLKESMEIERQLKEKELLMEAHLTDAQLKYLQAQINPHFLFNTLNAGAQLAMMEDADKTYEYVQKVANFFRYNVKKENDVVSIREEINLINDYIYILNVRFSGDIYYEQNIEEEWLDVQMPSMILQPIVENCVNHGIREMAGEGKIWLSVYEMDGVVCISIGDNGVGMSSEMINQVLSGSYKEKKTNGDSNGVAMDNVIARLRLFTGNEKVLDIYSEGEGMGTEFVIYLKHISKAETCERTEEA
ncbi:MAG: histidine kinase [Eubacterium sp.]|nr:histidine kinase [Eubacterium sp.]